MGEQLIVRPGATLTRMTRLRRLRLRLPAPARHISPATAALIAITGLALAGRLYQLDGRSLWLDEVATATYAHLSSPAEVIARTRSFVNQMPLFYMAIWLLRPLGDSAVALRLPAVVAGTLAVVPTYLIGRRTLGVRAGLVAALLMALMPYAVWYSQEARDYAQLMLLTTLQMYFAYRAVESGRGLDWLGLSLITVLNLYTHYLALASTAAIGFYVLCVFLTRLPQANQRVRFIGLTYAVVVLGAFLFADYDALDRVPQIHDRYGIDLVVVLGLLLAGFAVLERRLSRVSRKAVTGGLLAGLALLGLAAALGRPPLDGLPGTALALAVAAVLGALGIAAIGMLFEVTGGLDDLSRQVRLALISGALAVAAYLPWLTVLDSLIHRPDQTVSRLQPGEAIGLGDLVALLGNLGLLGPVLVFMGLGLATFAVQLRGRFAEAALVPSALGISILVMVASGGPAIVTADIRYFAALFPAAVLTIAAGVEGSAKAADYVVHRIWARNDSWWRLSAVGVSAGLAGVLLVQILPALAASYAVPKNDYRGATEHIVNASPPGSVVLGLGKYSTWAVNTFGYYLRQMNAPMVVIDAADINGDNIAHLTSSAGEVWGVEVFPTAGETSLLSAPGALTVDYVDVTGKIDVVRVAAAGLSTLEKARTVLQWEEPQEVRLSAPIKLLGLIDGNSKLGPSLVPTLSAGRAVSAEWSFDQGVSVQHHVLSLSPTPLRQQVDAAVTAAIATDSDYLLSFDYRNPSLAGTQWVYAIALDQNGGELATLPIGSGHQCPNTSDWASSYIVFHAPTEAVAIELVLRAQGSGTAQFDRVEMRSLDLD